MRKIDLNQVIATRGKFYVVREYGLIEIRKQPVARAPRFAKVQAVVAQLRAKLKKQEG